MVEEASAAAGSLEEQSRQLSNAVAAFHLGEEAADPAPASTPQAAAVVAESQAVWTPASQFSAR
jgi:hypothetical protein